MADMKKDKKDVQALPEYLYHQGTNFEAWKYMGVHRAEKDCGYIYTFRVYAPRAYSVSLVSDFTGWESGLEMSKISEGGTWQIDYKTDVSLEGMKYKFKVISKNGCVYKADPFASYSETMSKNASIIHTESRFSWRDAQWLKKRREITSGEDFYSAPLNIYELQLSSWKTRDGKTNIYGDAYLSYREIADLLVPYLKKMGYTHAEILPVTEFPYDGSWGYQVTGYFAPTSRFGTPEDFKYFVNKLHANGLGVIMDWVPAHFPKDEAGLAMFDGEPLYEYSDFRMERKEWGTHCFDLGRCEVQSFLVSSALYFFSEYHIDGIRVDAVASMLYIDFGRKAGEWQPNMYGGNEALDAVAFLRKLNTEVFARFPDVLMIAEESTAWPLVTKPVYLGGLGFNFKWNMGWANDMYDYTACDPYFRKGIHNKLTFSLCYAFSENYILPVSHDEVVHGKKSLIEKMFGDYDMKFAGDRVFMAYQMLHPGKKMTFMGCEFGQFREWDFQNQLEWFLLDYPKHRQLSEYVRKLNNFYLKTPALWQRDFSWQGFKWIEADLCDLNMIGFSRFDKDGNEIICVLNFSGVCRKNFSIAVSGDEYTEVLNSDDKAFGGEGMLNKGRIKAKNGYITIKVAALSASVLAPAVKKESVSDGMIEKTEE